MGFNPASGPVHGPGSIRFLPAALPAKLVLSRFSGFAGNFPHRRLSLKKAIAGGASRGANFLFQKEDMAMSKFANFRRFYIFAQLVFFHTSCKKYTPQRGTNLIWLKTHSAFSI
jgi:hypothetical protein